MLEYRYATSKHENKAATLLAMIAAIAPARGTASGLVVAMIAAIAAVMGVAKMIVTMTVMAHVMRAASGMCQCTCDSPFRDPHLTTAGIKKGPPAAAIVTSRLQVVSVTRAASHSASAPRGQFAKKTTVNAARLENSSLLNPQQHPAPLAAIVGRVSGVQGASVIKPRAPSPASPALMENFKTYPLIRWTHARIVVAAVISSPNHHAAPVLSINTRKSQVKAHVSPAMCRWATHSFVSGGECITC